MVKKSNGSVYQRWSTEAPFFLYIRFRTSCQCEKWSVSGEDLENLTSLWSFSEERRLKLHCYDIDGAG